jgi:hypothetical protein
MKYFSSTADLFERIVQRRPEKRKVRLPNSLEVFKEDCRYEPRELVKWFRDEAFEIARAFDKRNGNQYVSWELADDRALALGLPIPRYPDAQGDAVQVSRLDARPTNLMEKRS